MPAMAKDTTLESKEIINELQQDQSPDVNPIERHEILME